MGSQVRHPTEAAQKGDSLKKRSWLVVPALLAQMRKGDTSHGGMKMLWIPRARDLQVPAGGDPAVTLLRCPPII